MQQRPSSSPEHTLWCPRAQVQESMDSEADPGSSSTVPQGQTLSRWHNVLAHLLIEVTEKLHNLRLLWGENELFLSNTRQSAWHNIPSISIMG